MGLILTIWLVILCILNMAVLLIFARFWAFIVHILCVNLSGSNVCQCYFVSFFHSWIPGPKFKRDRDQSSNQKWPAPGLVLILVAFLVLVPVPRRSRRPVPQYVIWYDKISLLLLDSNFIQPTCEGGVGRRRGLLALSLSHLLQVSHIFSWLTFLKSHSSCSNSILQLVSKYLDTRGVLFIEVLIFLSIIFHISILTSKNTLLRNC